MVALWAQGRVGKATANGEAGVGPAQPHGRGAKTQLSVWGRDESHGWGWGGGWGYVRLGLALGLGVGMGRT